MKFLLISDITWDGLAQNPPKHVFVIGAPAYWETYVYRSCLFKRLTKLGGVPPIGFVVERVALPALPTAEEVQSFFATLGETTLVNIDGRPRALLAEAR